MTRPSVVLGACLLWVRTASADPILFTYQPPVAVQSVHLAGSFNGWDTSAQPMTDEAATGRWRVTVDLPPGEHQYKFVVNGAEWREDPASVAYTPDGFGGRNSVVRVGPGAAAPVHSARGDGRIHLAAVYHGQQPYDLTTLAPSRLLVRIRVNRDDCESVRLRIPGREVPMAREGSDRESDYFRAVVNPDGPELRYGFLLVDGATQAAYGDFTWRRAERPVFETPSWARDAVVYHIFPERFANGNVANDPPGAVPWGSPPTYTNFMGGDLEGVLEKLPYLQALGVTALYFNPIFQSPSNHKYNTTDYHRVDEHLGGDPAFTRLAAACRKKRIRLILDGVFNHSGTGFMPFQDVVAHGAASRYANWYFVKSFPVATTGKPNYDCWWGFGELPKLNTGHPEVMSYFMEVGRTWLRRGADGWRLDVPNEVPHPVWKEFRKVVKRTKPDGYIVGEIWQSGLPWLQGDEFDAVMNYRFRDACLEFFASQTADAAAFDAALQKARADTPEPAFQVAFNLLGSHDTPRFLTLAQGEAARLKLAALFQMTYPGAPVVYYGDEVGMTGGKDPDNRRGMLWEPGRQDRDVLETYRTLIRLRARYPALRAGDLKTVSASGRLYAFARWDGKDRFLVVINNSRAPASLEIPADRDGPPWAGTYRDLLSGVRAQASDAGLSLSGIPPMTGLLLHVE